MKMICLALPSISRGLSSLGALTAALAISGCATAPPPAGTISESNYSQLQASFTASLVTINTTLAAGAAGDAAVAKNFIDTGMALADMQCKNYFKNLGLAAQKNEFARKELTLTSGVAAGVQGLTGVSTKIIAITASMFSFASTSGEIYADTFLFSPEISGVQVLVENAQTAYRRAVPATTGMSYGVAAALLRDYDKLCEVQTIRRLVNESVTAGTPVADKATEAQIAPLVTTAERYLIAREVGESTLSTDQIVRIYWLVFGAPSESDLPIIARGLQGIPLFVGTDGALKPLVPADLKKIKNALASLMEREEKRLAEAIIRLRTGKTSTPGTTEKSGGSAGQSSPAGGSISIKVR